MVKINQILVKLLELTSLHFVSHARIGKLENVRDVVEESREANLRGKKYVQSLGLKWQDPRAQSGEDAESPIEGLEPHPNLWRREVSKLDEELWVESA